VPGEVCLGYDGLAVDHRQPAVPQGHGLPRDDRFLLLPLLLFSFFLE